MFQNTIIGIEQKCASKETNKKEHWKENHRGKTNYFTGKYATSWAKFFIAFVNIL